MEIYVSNLLSNKIFLYQEKKKIFLQVVVFNSDKYFLSENYS